MTLVLAGCGDLGTEIGLRAAAGGRRVVGLRRRAEVLPEAIEGRSVDLLSGPPELPDDTEAVILALTPSERSVEGYHRGYREPLEHVLSAVQSLDQSPRIVWISSTAVHGGAVGWVDETTPRDAGEGTPAVLAACEDAVWAQGGIVLRLSGIVGPGRDRLIREVRTGAPIARAHRPMNIIHRDDAARAALHLLDLPVPEPLYLGTDGAPATRLEAARAIAAELGLPAPAPAEEPTDEDDRARRLRSNRLEESGFSFDFPDHLSSYSSILRDEGLRHP